MKLFSGLRSSAEYVYSRGVSAATLGREVLATTERLAPQLAAVIQSENQATVDIQFFTSLSKLEADLLRLKWMLGKLK